MDVTTCEKCGEYTPYSKRKDKQLCWNCQVEERRAKEGLK